MSATAGTIFHDTRLPLWKWFLATYLLCESRKGMSANQMMRILKVSYKTARYLCHRIRAAMIETGKSKLTGTVEVDETYVGGKKHGIGQSPDKAEKEVVMDIRQRNGDLRFLHVKMPRQGRSQNISAKTSAASWEHGIKSAQSIWRPILTK
ncbi:MAG: IS1595 family transposase [Candidatus Acidiferrales bacterium]